MAEEVKEFVLGFVFAVVGVIIGANLLPVLMNATGNLPSQYAWAGSIITILASVGILMFALRAFRVF